MSGDRDLKPNVVPIRDAQRKRDAQSKAQIKTPRVGTAKKSHVQPRWSQYFQFILFLAVVAYFMRLCKG